MDMSTNPVSNEPALLLVERSVGIREAAAILPNGQCVSPRTSPNVPDVAWSLL
jgi:hypothetical protein